MFDDNIKEFKEWLADNELQVRDTKEYGNGYLINLKQCPFSKEHTDGAYIFFKPKHIVARCHHDSCKKNNVSWNQLYFAKTGKKYNTKDKRISESKNIGDKNVSLINVLEEAFENNILEAFRDEYNTIYCSYYDKKKDTYSIYELHSYELRLIIQKLMVKVGMLLKTNDMNKPLDYIAIKAYENDRIKKIHKRFCTINDKHILYELNPNMVASIKDGKVEVLKNKDIVFKHDKLYSEQVMINPKDEVKDYKKLLKYIKRFFNFANDKDVALFAIYLCVAFTSDITPMPLILVSSEKGSAKSTMARFFETILEPKNLDLCSIPTDRDGLYMRLNNSAVCVFDNLSYIKADISDTLCRAVTNGTQTRRTLYENSHETTFNLKSIVMINGTSPLIFAEDLLDRTIQFNLNRITADKMITEKELNNQFNKELPNILLLCMHIIGQAMLDDEPVDMKNSIRLGDFYAWAVKVGKVLGYKQSYVDSLFAHNSKKINDQLLDENTVGKALLIFMEYRKEYEAPYAELYKELKRVAMDNKLDTTSNGFPTAVNSLSRRINAIQSNLRDCGLEIFVTSTRTCKRIKIINNKSKRDKLTIVDEV